MYFFDDQDFAMAICEKAIKEHVCYECKCTDMATTGSPTGVICFYLNGDDVENHRRVIQFMLENQLVRHDPMAEARGLRRQPIRLGSWWKPQGYEQRHDTQRTLGFFQLQTLLGCA